MSEKLNKRKIEKDWLNVFTDFAKYLPMNFIKRKGSFLVGIYLQPILSSTRYRVCFYVYDLMYDLEIPTVPLTSSVELKNKKGATNSFSMQEHNNSFEKIVQDLKNQVPLLQKEDFSYQELASYMKSVVDEINGETTLRDIVLLNYWCGNTEQAEKKIKKGKEIILKWSERVTKSFGGAENWENQVRTLMNKDTLSKTISEQLQKYELENIEDYGLN
ncbi:hypothetical protein KLA_15720 [Cellulophaga geojensis KL-A]|uniref:Uncharacterized protein n=1 Tax=Cellulophaga geojensis KL-A TaxID=1328323 RepID=A0ABN0RK40_9FLAO|nr:hypothetical protein [Cellulophaga geojensis]EWH11459.1 hypothetical protein KLA_15720 [Cellulophaga geojensis KL-A]